MAGLTISLRHFSPADLDRILEIERASFPKEAYPRSLFEDFYSRHPEGLVVAEAAGRLVGYAMGYRAGPRASIVSLAVDGPFRKRGIARSLCRQLLKQFRSDGARSCWLQVRTANRAAIGLYKKLGFRIVATLESYYSDGQDGYLMARRV